MCWPILSSSLGVTRPSRGVRHMYAKLLLCTYLTGSPRSLLFPLLPIPVLLTLTIPSHRLHVTCPLTFRIHRAAVNCFCIIGGLPKGIGKFFSSAIIIAHYIYHYFPWQHMPLKVDYRGWRVEVGLAAPTSKVYYTPHAAHLKGLRA